MAQLADSQNTMARPIDILLVEDYPADARLTVEALRDARIANRVSIVGDGEEALKFLRREKPYEDANRPDFVLLDLDLPKMDGREVLNAMRADPQLRLIPVIVFTSSKKEEDVVGAYENQVAAFLRKPVEPDQYFAAIRSLKEFWFNVVFMPKAG
jgi:CheY-like chemotaxis protein